MSDIIQVKDLTKLYGNTLAVDHLSFEDKGTIPLHLDLLILLGFVFLLFGLSLFIFKKRIRQEFLTPHLNPLPRGGGGILFSTQGGGFDGSN